MGQGAEERLPGRWSSSFIVDAENPRTIKDSMTKQEICFEVVKLAAQFCGALAIAWLAVRWALSRYKSEKTWERQFTAYNDAVTALSELKHVTSRRYDDAIMRLDRPEEYEEALADRHRKARRRLDEALASALLLLPEDKTQTLSKLVEELDRPSSCDTYEDHLDERWAVLRTALQDVIREGRETLAIK